MSALGQKRTHAAQQYHSLFDHLVGLRKKAWGDGYAEGLGCPEVDHQLELGRCLHGEVGGFFAFKDAIDIASRLPELLDGISAIRHQPAAGGKEAVVIDGRQSVTSGKGNNQFAMRNCKRASRHYDAAIR